VWGNRRGTALYVGSLRVVNNPSLAYVCGVATTGSVSIGVNPSLRRLDRLLQLASSPFTHSCASGRLDLLAGTTGGRCQRSRSVDGSGFGEMGLQLSSNPFVGGGPTRFAATVMLPPTGSGYLFAKASAPTGKRYFAVYVHPGGATTTLYYMCTDQVQRKVRWSHPSVSDERAHDIVVSTNDAVAGLAVDGVHMGVQPLACLIDDCGQTVNSTTCRAHVGQRTADEQGRTFPLLGCILSATLDNTADALFSGTRVDLRDDVLGGAPGSISTYAHDVDAAPIPERASASCAVGPLPSTVPSVAGSAPFAVAVVFQSDAPGSGYGYLMAKTGAGLQRFYSLYVHRYENSLSVYYTTPGSAVQQRVSFPAMLRDGKMHSVVMSVSSTSTLTVVIDGVQSHTALLAGTGVDDCSAGPSSNCTMHLGERDNGNFPYTGGCILLAHMFPGFMTAHPTMPMLSASAVSTTAPPTATPTAAPTPGYGYTTCLVSLGTPLVVLVDASSCGAHVSALNAIVAECGPSGAVGRFECVDATSLARGFAVQPNASSPLHDCDHHAAVLNQAVEAYTGLASNFSCRGGGFLIHTPPPPEDNCGEGTADFIAALNALIQGYYSNSFRGCSVSPTAAPTAAPTASSAPTTVPTTATPTASPVAAPTVAPTLAPSASPTASPTRSAGFYCLRYNDAMYMSVAGPALAASNDLSRLDALARHCGALSSSDTFVLGPINATNTGVGAQSSTTATTGGVMAAALNHAVASYSLGQMSVRFAQFSSSNFTFFFPTRLFLYLGSTAACDQATRYATSS